MKTKRGAVLVYVDNAFVERHGYHWCHLLADSVNELHEFAEKNGLNARAFHRTARIPHYDITRSQRPAVLARGAKPVTVREGIRFTQHLALQVSSQPECPVHQQDLFA